MAVVANVDADAAMARFEDGVPSISGSEIEFFPKARVAMRDMMLSVLAEIAPVGVEHGGRVVEDPRHFHFVDGNDHHHFVLLGEFLHALEGWAMGYPFGELVPASILLGAKVGTVEKFLQTEDLNILFRCRRDEFFVLGNHFFFDIGERIFLRRPFASGLDNTATDDPRHEGLLLLPQRAKSGAPKTGYRPSSSQFTIGPNRSQQLVVPGASLSAGRQPG